MSTLSNCLKQLSLMSLLYPVTLLAAGGNESMEQQNLRPLPSLPTPSQQPIPDFKLPPVKDNPSIVPGGERKLHVIKINLSGNTVLDDIELQDLIHSYQGRDVSINELEKLRQDISLIYTQKGYINSGAVLAADAYKEGVLNFKLIEGRLTEVILHGQEGLQENYIKKRLLGNDQQPLNMPELQDRFQRLLSDPLISRLNASLLPGTTPGQSILDVNVERAKTYQLSVLGNNQRPPSIGAEAFGVNGWVKNLTGFGDTVDFTFYNSAGSKRYIGSLNIPISYQDTQAFFRFDEGDSLVQEQPINKLNITSQVHNLEGGVSHPFINTSKQILSLGTLLAVRENQTYLSGLPFSFVAHDLTGHTQATVARFFQDYSQRWEEHAISLHSSFTTGLNTLGATPKSYTDFFSWLGQAQYIYKINDEGSQFIIRGNTQLSNTALLPLERFAIGGLATVRGYRENQLVRDEGYNLSTEFKYRVLSKFAITETKSQIYLVPFLDYGSAVNLGESAQTLISIGTGVELDWRILHTSVYYGYALNPLPQKQGDLQDAGIHFKTRLDLL